MERRWTHAVLDMDGIGAVGVLLLGMAARSTGDERGAKAEPVLEIMSLDQGDCTLGLSLPWGAMAVNHVQFNDHQRPLQGCRGIVRQGSPGQL